MRQTSALASHAAMLDKSASDQMDLDDGVAAEEDVTTTARQMASSRCCAALVVTLDIHLPVQEAATSPVDALPALPRHSQR